jgi:MFS family permease
MKTTSNGALDSPLAANTGGVAGVSGNVGALITDPVGHWRWIICGLLFFATTFNYVDRQVIGLLKPTLQHELNWSELDYAHIILLFQMAYALGYLVMGPLIDRLGTRRGYTVAALIWSFAAMAHAAARSVLQFGEARFALGLGEGGSFPASIKTVAEWFPRKERALATAIFNSGTNLGPIVVPLIIPWFTVHYGWRMTFIVTGALNLIWILPWLLIIARRKNTRAFPRRSLPTFAATRPSHPRRFRGAICLLIANCGRLPSRNFSPIRFGGFSCFGCRTS